MFYGPKCFLGPHLQEAARILKAIPYNENVMYVHTDTALMPRIRQTWASWNFIARWSLPPHRPARALAPAQ